MLKFGYKLLLNNNIYICYTIYIMKLILSLLFFAGFGILNAQNFSASAPISIGEGFGFNHPQIEITNDGLPFVIWADQSTRNMYTSKYDGISQFSTPLSINPANLDVQSYNWSGADVAIESDNVFVVFRSLGYETGHVYLVKSTDNGLTFSDTVRVDDLSTGFGQYPDIAVHQDTVWVTFMDHDANGLNSQYVVSRSVDGGATFQTETMTSSIVGAEACDCCQPEIIVNNEYVIVYFRNNDNNIRDIKGVISFDRGVTFSTWFSVDDHLWNINACPSTGPDSRFLDANTSVTTYKTTFNGSAQVYVNEYNHLTNSSTNIARVYDSESDNLLINFPQIATNNGVIGIVWEAKGTEQGSGTDIFINSSSTGATGLYASNAFNLTNVTGNQNKPDIALTSNKFHVIYTDLSDGILKYVTLQSLTEIKENSNLPIISIHPNPVINEINIDFIENSNRDGQLIINSVTGKEVYNNTINQTKGSIKIDITKWEKGLYLINCTVNGKKTTHKIII
jgi:hypothetical protein